MDYLANLEVKSTCLSGLRHGLRHPHSLSCGIVSRIDSRVLKVAEYSDGCKLSIQQVVGSASFVKDCLGVELEV